MRTIDPLFSKQSLWLEDTEPPDPCLKKMKGKLYYEWKTCKSKKIYFAYRIFSKDRLEVTTRYMYL